jgi:hypothetical protein
MPIQASPHTSQLLKLSDKDRADRPMEGDSDAEMADYGTDFADDVDRNFDAKARPQQGSTSKYAVPTSSSRAPKGT